MTAGAAPRRQDITVRRSRCMLRRRGGWAWGDPEAYLVRSGRRSARPGTGAPPTRGSLPTSMSWSPGRSPSRRPRRRGRLVSTESPDRPGPGLPPAAPGRPAGLIGLVAPVAAVAVPDDPGTRRPGQDTRPGPSGRPPEACRRPPRSRLAPWAGRGRLDVVGLRLEPGRRGLVRFRRWVGASGPGPQLPWRRPVQVAAVVLSP